MSIEPPTAENVSDEVDVTETPAPAESELVPEPETVDAEAAPDQAACESTLSEEQQQDPPEEETAVDVPKDGPEVEQPIEDTVADVPKDGPEFEHADTVEAPPTEVTGGEADSSEPEVAVIEPEVSELPFEFVLRTVNMR